MRKRQRMDRALTSLRTQPRDELVEEISARVGTTRPESPWPRVAYAASVAVMVVGTFASFGGLTYAASGTTKVAGTVAKVAASHKVVVVKSSASSQYAKPKAPLKPPPAAPKPAPEQTLGTTTAGTLPFTGLSLLGTFLLSFGLMLTGFLLRRRGRSDRT